MTRNNILGCLLIVGIFLGFCFFTVWDWERPYQYDDTKIVAVYEGTTLWDIASKYSDNRHNTDKVVWMIKHLNDLEDSTIYGGQHLVVPLFNNMRE